MTFCLQLLPRANRRPFQMMFYSATGFANTSCIRSPPPPPPLSPLATGDKLICEINGGGESAALMTSNQGTKSTAGHYAQGKLKQKVTYNLYTLIDLSREDKHSLVENLLNV